MPTSAELALVLRFRDEATVAMKAATQGIGQTLTRVGRSVEEVGLQLRRVSRELLQVGVVISGAFTIAFVEAGQHIPAVRDALGSLTHQVLAFQESLAKAALPVLQQLTQFLKGANDAFNALDASTRDFIIRATLTAGILALLAGTIGRLAADFLLITGRVAQWAGALIIAHPYLVLIGIAVGVLITVMGGWEKAIMMAGRAIDVLIEALQVFWNLLKGGILVGLWAVITALEGIAKAVALMPGQWGQWARESAKSLDALRQTLQKDVVDALTDAGGHMGTMVTRFKEGGGAAENLAGSMVKMAETIKRAMSGAQVQVHDFFGKLGDDLSKFWTSYSNVQNTVAQTLTQGITTLDSKLTTVFSNLITNGGKAKDFFVNFGKAFLETIIAMIAKLLAFATVLLIINAIPGGRGFLAFLDASARSVPTGTAAVFAGDIARGAQIVRHQGGIIPERLQRFQEGGEVLAMVQPGEFVVNRQATARNRSLLERVNRGEATGGGMNVQNVFIINAIDEASFRGKLQQHADLIESMFQRAIKRNSGPMREAVRI